MWTFWDSPFLQNCFTAVRITENRLLKILPWVWSHFPSRFLRSVQCAVSAYPTSFCVYHPTLTIPYPSLTYPTQNCRSHFLRCLQSSLSLHKHLIGDNRHTSLQEFGNRNCPTGLKWTILRKWIWWHTGLHSGRLCQIQKIWQTRSLGMLDF